MLLMIACINFHYYLGASATKISAFHGPAAAAQRAAHVRLAVAADALIDRSPEDIVFKDWSSDLRSTSVSYSGEEVQTCYQTETALIEPDALDAPVVTKARGKAARDGTEESKGLEASQVYMCNE